MSNSILILKIKHIEIPDQTNYNLLIFSQINFIRNKTKNFQSNRESKILIAHATN